jgi:predicted nucleic acid-binding protein
VAQVADVLIDTSAASRPAMHAILAPMIDGGIVATTAGLDFEALFSARTATDYAEQAADRRHAYEYLPTEDRHWQAALSAQAALAARGRHGAVGIIDLLTAVLAAEHRLTVLHYDADFEVAAEVVDFEHRWVAPRGSVD